MLNLEYSRLFIHFLRLFFEQNSKLLTVSYYFYISNFWRLNLHFTGAHI